MSSFLADRSKLLAKQEKQWSPLIKWAERHFGVEISSTKGLSLSQPVGTEDRLRESLLQMNDWQLVAFEEAVRSSKSFIVSAALMNRAITVDAAAEGWFSRILAMSLDPPH